MCMRAKQGFPDPTPTLVDIERTHILNEWDEQYMQNIC